MPKYCAGKTAHLLLVWYAVTFRIFVSCWPLPTVHKDVVDREDSAPEEIAAQQVSPENTLGLMIGMREGRDILAQPTKNTSEPKELRKRGELNRRIKSPVRRMNRILLLLKSEMGKVSLALEDVKDECHRKKITRADCANQKVYLQLQGKLRRLRSATLTVKENEKEAALIQNMESQAQNDLENATKYQNKAKTMLSGRMIALKDVDKRIQELRTEDVKNAELERRWQMKLNETWVTMRKANEAQRVVESFNVKFSSKLRGALNGIKIGDDNAADDFDAAEEINKKAELIERRAKLFEDKAEKLEEDAGKKADFEEDADEVQYQENKDGILASDSSSALDSFGKGHPHPKFAKNHNFVAQRQPLLVHQDKLNRIGFHDNAPVNFHDKVSAKSESHDNVPVMHSKAKVRPVHRGANLFNKDHLSDGADNAESPERKRKDKKKSAQDHPSDDAYSAKRADGISSADDGSADVDAIYADLNGDATD